VIHDDDDDDEGHVDNDDSFEVASFDSDIEDPEVIISITYLNICLYIFLI
jgi:hypothetical protein